MTSYERKCWIRIQRRVRKIELLQKITIALVVAADVATIACVLMIDGHQEPREPAAEEITQEEQEPAAAPINVEIEPRYNITEEELDLVARVVHAEAQGEGFEGQALVAQCILNTAEATGQRPDEVVLAPKQYATPAAEASEEVKAAVRAVFVDGFQVTDEPIRWFYAYKRCTSEWHESKTHVLTYKNHKFFA